MSDKKTARPILVLFVLAFMGIIGILYLSMDWVDSMRSPSSGRHAPAGQQTPDIYAPD